MTDDELLEEMRAAFHELIAPKFDSLIADTRGLIEQLDRIEKKMDHFENALYEQGFKLRIVK